MENVSSRRRPALPPDFYRPEPALTLLAFVYGFALYFGCGYACYMAALSSVGLWLKLPSVLLLGLLSSNGLHLLGWLAHEGVHLSLVRDKNLNMLLGAFAGSVLFFSSVGLGISHWPHHRFTNQARDPDTLSQARQQTFLGRLLLARPRANRQYLKEAFDVLLDRPRDSTYRLPFSNARLRQFAAASFGFMLIWLGFYVTIAARAPGYALCAFLFPYLLLVPVTGLRIYVEHAGTSVGEFVDARSYTSPLYTVLLFGNNYHLEHHLYPSVPSYKLPRVHRRLAAEGFYERHGASIVPGVFGPLRFTFARHPYPDARLRLAREELAPYSQESTADA
jgi:fatty acid desaturase